MTEPRQATEPQSSARPLIVISLEGFAASSLGCYGSSWSLTPAIDRLASAGVVWDRLIATDDDPVEVLRQWLAGGTSLLPFRTVDSHRPSGSIELITDDLRLDTDEIDEVFDVVDLVPFDLPVADVHATDVPTGQDVQADPSRQAGLNVQADQADEETDEHAAASSIEQTHLAQLMMTAMERLADPEPLAVMWIHSRFLTAQWDAPRDLIPPDELETDDDEPSDEPELLVVDQTLPHQETLAKVPFVYPGIRPPRVAVDSETHPDVVTSWMRTYACQVRLLDDLLAILLDAAGMADRDVVIAGTSGFALGQNKHIGHHCGPLRSSELRLPLIVCRGESSDRQADEKEGSKSQSAALRVPQLHGSTAFPSVLARLADPDAAVVTAAQWACSQEAFEPAIVTRSDRCRVAVSTPRWFCVTDREAEDREAEVREAEVREAEDRDLETRDIPVRVVDPCLFLKPDDVDDVNDVSRLRIDAVDKLVSIAARKNPSST